MVWLKLLLITLQFELEYISSPPNFILYSPFNNDCNGQRQMTKTRCVYKIGKNIHTKFKEKVFKTITYLCVLVM